MIAVERTVYYCEFCKRHRLTKASIAHHEPRCIYNPLRTACGWHSGGCGDARELAVKLADGLDLEGLRSEADGCPAGMLAAVVQSGLSFEEKDVLGFDYKAEVERFRQEEAVGVW